MFYLKGHTQLNSIDPWGHPGPKRRKMLDTSRVGLFRRAIRHGVSVDTLREDQDDSEGGPTKELCSMVGLTIHRLMSDLTDEPAVDESCFNVPWGYALDITEEADAYSYVDFRSLWTTRDHLTEKVVHKLAGPAKKLRVRGMKAVTYAAIIRAIGLNIRRAAASRLWAKTPERSFGLQICALVCFFFHLSEQIGLRFEQFTTGIRQNRPDHLAYLKRAA